ncbi:ribbon-helix-helix protein, CopG family [Rhizobium sp. SL42]|uniref:ribbon-helix-helix protein, CopG family n=1 Tax=Rhizobium sp. SL42 TaxID=2806346 RepID=UPI001F032374|nr:ribbon-helix-helix protein, CopG family [Rhizobium sp. SL42]UJW74020.1 ribbon-helix-helix protein, CopG family [Rhizobium sp. SL42]
MREVAKQSLTVYLDPDVVARIETMIGAGRFANSSEIVQEALVLWLTTFNQHQFELELKRAYESSLALTGRESVNAATFLRTLGDLA